MERSVEGTGTVLLPNLGPAYPLGLCVPPRSGAFQERANLQRSGSMPLGPGHYKERSMIPAREHPAAEQRAASAGRDGTECHICPAAVLSDWAECAHLGGQSVRFHMGSGFEYLVCGPDDETAHRDCADGGFYTHSRPEAEREFTRRKEALRLGGQDAS